MTDYYDPKNPKMLANWFDVNSRDHVLAYREMRRAGSWPQWFVDVLDDENVIIHDGWSTLIEHKMVWARVHYTLGSDTVRE